MLSKSTFQEIEFFFKLHFLCFLAWTNLKKRMAQISKEKLACRSFGNLRTLKGVVTAWKAMTDKL